MITRNTPCNQAGCPNKADYRFTWPGRDEAGICHYHKGVADRIVAAMGLYVQFIPLPKEGQHEDVSK